MRLSQDELSKSSSWLSAAVLAAALTACGTTVAPGPNDSVQITGPGFFAPGPTQATAQLLPKSNSRVYGVVTFKQNGNKVGVAAAVFNMMNTGPYSIYIHETGNCSSPNAASAGPVWQIPGAPPGAKRAGDLPELWAGTEANGAMQATLTGLSVGDGAPTDVVGHAVVVHNGIDRDPKPQFGGAPNGWIACGVITKG
jgi:Cu-Zn family superoxide dismutase